MKLLDDVPFSWPGEPDRPSTQKATIADVSIDIVDFKTAVETILEYVDRRVSGRYVVTPNAHHIVLFQNDEPFRRIYDEALLVVPDGVPLIWASKLLGTPLPCRVNGTDLFEALCARAADLGLRVFLLGGRVGAADAASAKLRERHPALQVCGTYCPPFGFERDPRERAKILEAVNDAQPHLLFVGLGSPKQEYWMYANRDAIDVPVAIGIGVSFEFVGGVLRRAPRWMQAYGLEWLFRLLSEPKRLWNRYLIGNTAFCLLIARQLLTKRFAPKSASRR